LSVGTSSIQTWPAGTFIVPPEAVLSSTGCLRDSLVQVPRST
jgi:hypothetical protein